MSVINGREVLLGDALLELVTRVDDAEIDANGILKFNNSDDMARVQQHAKYVLCAVYHRNVDPNQKCPLTKAHCFGNPIKIPY